MAQSTMMGKLADRVDIIKSGFSELEKAVIKATKHNTKPPKEKHVRRLIVYNHEQSHRIAELVNLLAKRLEVPDWIVVMKTLVVFHRLLRDSRPQFIAEMRYRSAVFNLRRFADMSSPEAHHQSIFIRKYAQYLEEKVLVFKITNIEFEKDPNATKSMSAEDAFEKIPRLQSQLNALLNCRASKDHINNNIIAAAFTLLLKDSFKLYSALNDGIINILENYFNMTKANATKALDIYKLFTKETDGIIQFFEISKRFSRSELPELQHAPTTLVEALEAYIKDLDDGKNPNPNAAGEQKSNLAKATTSLVKQFDDFKFDDDPEDDDSSDDEGSAPSKNADPFSSQPKQAPAPFDPFGFDSFAPPKQQQQTPFDPFAPAPAETQPTVSYDAKKKQIETLMTSSVNPPSMTPLAPSTLTPVTFPAQTGFPQNGFPNHFPPQKQSGFPATQPFAQPFGQPAVWNAQPVAVQPLNQPAVYNNPFLQPAPANTSTNNPFA